MVTRKGQESKQYFKVLVDGVEIQGFIKVQGLSYTTEIIEKSDNATGVIEKNLALQHVVMLSFIKTVHVNSHSGIGSKIFGQVILKKRM